MKGFGTILFAWTTFLLTVGFLISIGILIGYFIWN